MSAELIPQCLSIFKKEYPRYFAPLKMETLHITELVADALYDGKISLKGTRDKVTFQDPCRLGRFLEIFEEPRWILEHIPGVEFVEMERSGYQSICCGPGGWINCPGAVKEIQRERLEESVSTGAQTLITACPKCEIHFKCALKHQDVAQKIRVKDIVNLIAEAL